ncbi:MAG: DUF4395 domain-containing protein [Actinomycetota bacterium]|nr:DUF4395 domain-containing protein [Actinomycetota bacterium]
MSAQPPSRTVDARSFRFDQTVMAVAVLCGFVFEAPWVIPTFAALEASTAVQGQQAVLPRLWNTVLAPWLRRPSTTEDAGPWRTAAFLAAALLGIATIVLVVGDEGFSWVFALPAAGLGALAGVGGVCVGCQVHARRRG